MCADAAAQACLAGLGGEIEANFAQLAGAEAALTSCTAGLTSTADAIAAIPTLPGCLAPGLADIVTALQTFDCAVDSPSIRQVLSACLPPEAKAGLAEVYEGARELAGSLSAAAQLLAPLRALPGLGENVATLEAMSRDFGATVDAEARRVLSALGGSGSSSSSSSSSTGAIVGGVLGGCAVVGLGYYLVRSQRRAPPAAAAEEEGDGYLEVSHAV